MMQRTRLDYAEMILHTDVLTPEERELLRRRLFAVGAARELTALEKVALLRVTTGRTTTLAPLSDRREDWYADS